MEASGSSVYLQTKTSYVAAVNIFFPPTPLAERKHVIRLIRSSAPTRQATAGRR